MDFSRSPTAFKYSSNPSEENKSHLPVMSGTVVCAIVETPGDASRFFWKTALTMFCEKNMARGKVSGTFPWRVGGRKGSACGFLCASCPCGLPLLQSEASSQLRDFALYWRCTVVKWKSELYPKYISQKKVQALNFKPVWNWNFNVAAKRAQQRSTAQADSAIETDKKN